jgi:hypothetical protein
MSELNLKLTITADENTRRGLLLEALSNCNYAASCMGIQIEYDEDVYEIVREALANSGKDFCVEDVLMAMMTNGYSLDLISTEESETDESGNVVPHVAGILNFDRLAQNWDKLDREFILAYFDEKNRDSWVYFDFIQLIAIGERMYG